MIQGIGTDIISINRIAQLKNKEAFIKKILSQQEIAVYETFKSPKRQQEFLAGRFAAKEALYKALGARCEGYEYTDFVILNENPLDKRKEELRNLSIIATYKQGKKIYG